MNLANQADGSRDRVELTVQVLGPGLTGSRISAVDLSRRAKSNEIACAKNGCATNFQRGLGVMVTNFPLSAALLIARPASPKSFYSLSGKCPAAFLGALILGVEQVNC